MKKAIDRKGTTQAKLAELVGRSINTVWRWCAGNQEPSDKMKQKIAAVLDVSVSYLMGESDNEVSNLRGGRPEATRLDTSIIEIPVWGAANTACLGAGLPVFDDNYDGETTFVPTEFIGPYDKDNRPFVVRADGESMNDWDIPSGSMVVVNPSAEVLNMQIALVCYYDNLSIKKIKFLPTGAVELLASNDKTIHIKKEDNTPDAFKIWGRVVLVLRKPSHGI